MPGSVANAVAAGVMPFGLAKAFTESREFAMRKNEYVDGTTQRASRVGTSRRRFVQTRRLTPATVAALRTFRDSVRHGAFYFYHSKETNPMGLAGYDATGVATAGRYTVRFEGDWSENVFIPRAEVGIVLVEVA